MIENQYTKSQKYAIISVLIMIMDADGMTAPQEIEFLDDVLKFFSISETDMDVIRQLELAQDIEIIKKMNEAQSREITDLFMGMAKCDGYADPREIHIIKTLTK